MSLFQGVLFGWRTALKNWGWLLLLIAVVAISYLRPAKVVVDEVIAPAAEQVGIGRTCPAGWANKSSQDEHLQVLSCQKDGWLVVLDGEGKFQHGFQLDTPNAQFIFDKSKVPGWPQQ